MATGEAADECVAVVHIFFYVGKVAKVLLADDSELGAELGKSPLGDGMSHYEHEFAHSGV